MTEEQVVEEAIDSANALAVDYWQDQESHHVLTISEDNLRLIIRVAMKQARSEAFRGN